MYSLLCVTGAVRDGEPKQDSIGTSEGRNDEHREE